LSWTLEYSGYLMLDFYGHHPTMYECVRVQTQYQEVLLIPVVPCSTMLKLTAMEWLVHLTTHRKNSTVQFVPNKVETTTHSVISVY